MTAQSRRALLATQTYNWIRTSRRFNILSYYLSFLAEWTLRKLRFKTAMGLLYRRIFLWEEVSYKPCGAAWGVTYPSLDSYITQGEGSSSEILLQ